MTWRANTPQLGIVDLTAVDTLAPGAVDLVGATNKSGRWPQLGSIVSGYDTTYGGGEFIYLKGNSSVVLGTVVGWDSNYQATALASTANTGRAVAVSLGTVTSTQYGWFQIQGTASVLKTAVAISPDSRVWISGTAGRLFATATTGKQILGARTVNAATVVSATSTILVNIMRPHAQGQII